MEKPVKAAAGTAALLTAAGLVYARAHPPKRNQTVLLIPVQSQSKSSVGIDPVVKERTERMTAPGRTLIGRSVEALARGDANEAERAYLAAEAFFRTLDVPNSVPPPQRKNYWFSWFPADKHLLGNIYMEQGRYRDAIDTYGIARRHPSGYVLHLNTALAFVRLGQPARARQFFREQFLKQQGVASEYIPARSLPHGLEARILLARGLEYAVRANDRRALADFRAVLRFDPTNGFVALQAARAAQYSNDARHAEQFYRQAAWYGRGKVSEEAKHRLTGFDATRKWRLQHGLPTQPLTDEDKN